jgi:hypothetical protein
MWLPVCCPFRFAVGFDGGSIFIAVVVKDEMWLGGDWHSSKIIEAGVTISKGMTFSDLKLKTW